MTPPEPRCPSGCGGTREKPGTMPKGGDEGATRYFCTDPFHSPAPSNQGEPTDTPADKGRWTIWVYPNHPDDPVGLRPDEPDPTCCLCRAPHGDEMEPIPVVPQALLEKAEARIEELEEAHWPWEWQIATRERERWKAEKARAEKAEAERLAAEEKVERAGAVLGELVTALDENADRLNISIALSAARDFLRLINGEDG